MDPIAALSFALESLRDGDTESARDYFGYLTDFMDRGGFAPVAALTRALDAIDNP